MVVFNFNTWITSTTSSCKFRGVDDVRVWLLHACVAGKTSGVGSSGPPSGGTGGGTVGRAGGVQAPAGLAGLFAGGMPTLKPTGRGAGAAAGKCARYVIMLLLHHIRVRVMHCTTYKSKHWTFITGLFVKLCILLAYKSSPSVNEDYTCSFRICWSDRLCTSFAIKNFELW